MVTAAWDTSNLVALYNNGKQCTSCCNTIPAVCEFCVGFQPATVRLTFSDCVDVNPAICTTAPGPTEVALFPGGTAGLLNGEHILPFVSGCLYRKDVVQAYEFDYWTVTPCTGPKVGIREHTILRITANGTGAGVLVIAQWLIPYQTVAFQGTILYTGDDVCFDTENTVNNIITGNPLSELGGVSVGTGIAGITV